MRMTMRGRMNRTAWRLLAEKCAAVMSILAPPEPAVRRLLLRMSLTW